ncbi:MAG: BlaI/MecI/CopY family transcriptional regulator [Deltaproteobacteria bacterium]|nr:BlaI/MecI/CopY family transcriptional regulator [Deltaproteobacteria bacterium]
MRRTLQPLFELEAQIMGIVWDHFPATAREVCERMTGPRARAYTTIMSTMDRLHKKGVLRRHKSGLAWVYSPTLSEAEFQRALADQLADRIVDEHGEVGLMAVVEAASTDQALLARLEALVAAHKHRTRR